MMVTGSPVFGASISDFARVAAVDSAFAVVGEDRGVVMGIGIRLSSSHSGRRLNGKLERVDRRLYSTQSTP